MKTEKNSGCKGAKALRVKDINKKTSCPGVLVAKAFTLAELITVVIIIAVLLGVLMPALSHVKKLALDTKQRAQITSIEAGILMYKNDSGSYPPSHGEDPNHPTGTSNRYPYCGAHTLSEAMFGQDLLGFHNDSLSFNIDDAFYSPSTVGSRNGPYLDRSNIGVFTPRQIFDRDTASSGLPLVAGRYMICDVFTKVSRDICDNSGKILIKSAKIGTPVLYFRANTSAVNTELRIYSAPNPIQHADNIYDWRDNYYLLRQGRISDGKEHPIAPFDSDTVKYNNGQLFYEYIRDPMIPSAYPADSTYGGRPVRPDSFLLISAGFDGLYGTKDDICNFTPNLQ